MILKLFACPSHSLPGNTQTKAWLHVIWNLHVQEICLNYVLHIRLFFPFFLLSCLPHLSFFFYITAVRIYVVWCDGSRITSYVFYPHAHCCGWRCMACKSPFAVFATCISVSSFVAAEPACLMVYEASARALVALDVDGWKYQFYVKRTYMHSYQLYIYT